MSDTFGCSFCEQLPGLAHPGRGSAGKCPLCKQSLWTTLDGATYRIVDGPIAAPTARWRWLAGAGVGLIAGLCVSVLIGRYAFQPETSESRQPVASTPIEAAVVPTVKVQRPTPIAKPPVMPVKPALPADAASVKPKPAPVEVAKATVKPIPWTFVDEAPRVKGISQSVPLAWKWTPLFTTESQLEAQLREVPLLELDPSFQDRTRSHSAQVAKDILDETKHDRDAFVRRLVKERDDLAGLPFLLGEDCRLTREQARLLARDSLRIREAFSMTAAEVKRSKSRASQAPNVYNDAVLQESRVVEYFWSELGRPKAIVAIPALHQIVLAQDKDFRMSVVDHLKETKSPEATRTLVNRALFDLNEDIRKRALEALADRPKAEYRALVMKAFRYPWAPVVRNASQAAKTLKLKDAIPDLVALLDEPDPGAPFTVKAENGTSKSMVRELVRINHHRNCMLCHAPADAVSPTAVRELSQTPVGPVPFIQDALPPPTSQVYYSARQGITLVRADITYLRQDFSMQQRVENPGHWPEMQRFDFLVRTRELTESELAQRPPPPAWSEYQFALVDALRTLTGRDAPPQAQAWRDELKLPTPKVVPQAK